MGTDESRLVDAWVIGEHDFPFLATERNVLRYREQYKPGNVIIWDRGNGSPWLDQFKVVTKTHFDEFYEWL